MAYEAHSLNLSTPRTLARKMVEGDSCSPDCKVEFRTLRRIRAQMRRALGLKRLPASSDSVSVHRQHLEGRLMHLCARCRGQGNFVTCSACHRRHWQLNGLLEDLGALISKISAQGLARLRAEFREAEEGRRREEHTATGPPRSAAAEEERRMGSGQEILSAQVGRSGR